MESQSEAVNKELLARLGLESETHLKAATAGSVRKQRMVEKMMVAELHNMQGELKVERSALRNENKALREAIDQLRLGAMKTDSAEKTAMLSPRRGTVQERDAIMEEVG